ncbi:MAG: T9SS type A sorting domain-containing protein [Ignavibacteriaceae bacterium]|nr:T9SS type A sorting domain-containing protein [Ignavibacteriaceae bacterium]
MKPFYLISVFFLTVCLCAQNAPQYTVNSNGTLRAKLIPEGADNYSENGIYSYSYSIGAVTDEMRELHSYRLFKNSTQQFEMKDVPGSDVTVSGSGYSLFYDHSMHFNREVTVNVYSPSGSYLFSKKYRGASGFTFSDEGNFLMVRHPGSTDLVELQTGSSRRFAPGLASYYNEKAQRLVIADETVLIMYENDTEKFRILHQNGLVRRIAVSEEGDMVAIISGERLAVFDLSGRQIWHQFAEAGKKYRDIKFEGSQLIAGIHSKNEKSSQGHLLRFDGLGRILESLDGSLRMLPPVKKLSLPPKNSVGYEPISWPFAPFDSARIVWNHYEQHMGYGADTLSYLHQGLDLIIPIAEPTYAVKGGIVKCVLTLGGAAYWRAAISDSQNSGVSDGWLYAHLIQSSIQVDIGDTIQQFDHIADIVAWTSTWAHIHFVQIKDSGTVWLYDDDEWGINFNPLFAITPLNDIQAPHIKPVFPHSKFAFTKNETNQYLSADNLSGVIDIVAMTVDSVCGSEWQQPATSVFYEIKNNTTGAVVKPRTLAHILNHRYSFYDSGNYEPYAGIIYKRNQQLLPSSWMSITRNYYHNLTNSDGDSVLTLQERELGLDTRDYPDGEYNIIVYAYDASGNSSADSMIVNFVNGISSVDEENTPGGFIVEQNYPNPFTAGTVIRYRLAGSENKNISREVKIRITDILGREIVVFNAGVQPQGSYEFNINEIDLKGLSSGIYFYQVSAGENKIIRKMIYLR